MLNCKRPAIRSVYSPKCNAYIINLKKVKTQNNK